MSARPSLSARLARVAEPAPGRGPAEPTAKGPAASSRKSLEEGRAPPAKARVGKTMIAGYFSPQMARAVKLLAVERGVTVQALIGEGLDHILRQAGKHPMGER